MKVLAALAFALALAAGETRTETLESCIEGLAAQRAGDYALAIDHITRCITRGDLETKNLAIAHYNRGFTYSYTGDNALAAQDFSEAIRLDPGYAPAYNGRCWVRGLMRRPEAALADCDEALRLRPNLATTLDSRALAYWLLGRHEEARQDLARARDLDSSVPSWEDRFRAFEALF